MMPCPSGDCPKNERLLKKLKEIQRQGEFHDIITDIQLAQAFVVFTPVVGQAVSRTAGTLNMINGRISKKMKERISEIDNELQILENQRDNILNGTEVEKEGEEPEVDLIPISEFDTEEKIDYMKSFLEDSRAIYQDDLDVSEGMSEALSNFTTSGAVLNITTAFISELKNSHVSNEELFNSLLNYANDMDKLNGQMRALVRNKAFQEYIKKNNDE
ncbi:hypothetical protein [Dokdonia sp.]|uniref:hypothetical protein n=1 Tax=Dokdonia sp. TaxID=2024995 RepID=UPI003265A9D7